MSNRFRIPGTLERRLEELGVSRVTVLRHAGLPMELLGQNRIWVTTEEMFAFDNAIEKVSGDPAIGLKL